MSDLTGELQRMADDAARQARPLATADVIRRGDRRRKRTIAQQSVGGLSIAGIAAAVIFTGAASGAPAAPTSSGATRGVTMLTETTSSPVGELTIEVKYQTEPRQQLKLLSVNYSGDSRRSASKPVLVFLFSPAIPPGPPPPPANLATQWQSARGHVYFFVVKLRPGDLRGFTGSLPLRDIRRVNRGGGLILGGALRAAIATNLSRHRRQITLSALVADGVIFTRT